MPYPHIFVEGLSRSKDNNLVGRILTLSLQTVVALGTNKPFELHSVTSCASTKLFDELCEQRTGPLFNLNR